MTPVNVIEEKIKTRNFPAPHSMKVTVVNPTNYILDGDIGQGSCDKVKVAVDKNYKSTLGTINFILNSPGGMVVEGLCIANYVKFRNGNTVVSNTEFKDKNIVVFDPRLFKKTDREVITCASACTYIFVAGTKRTLQGNVNFGIHNSAVPAQLLPFYAPAELEFSSTLSAGILERALTRYKVLDPDLREMFFKVPNSTIYLLRPEHFQKREALKLIATDYIDFFGYNSNPKKKE